MLQRSGGFKVLATQKAVERLILQQHQAAARSPLQAGACRLCTPTRLPGSNGLVPTAHRRFRLAPRICPFSRLSSTTSSSAAHGRRCTAGNQARGRQRLALGRCRRCHARPVGRSTGDFPRCRARRPGRSTSSQWMPAYTATWDKPFARLAAVPAVQAWYPQPQRTGTVGDVPKGLPVVVLACQPGVVHGRDALQPARAAGVRRGSLIKGGADTGLNAPGGAGQQSAQLPQSRRSRRRHALAAVSEGQFLTPQRRHCLGSALAAPGRARLPARPTHEQHGPARLPTFASCPFDMSRTTTPGRFSGTILRGADMPPHFTRCRSNSAGSGWAASMPHMPAPAVGAAGPQP